MKTTEATAILFLAAAHLAQGLIGYDCGGQTLNVTTFSTLEEPKCDTPADDATSENNNIQLLQLSEYQNTHVMQCKVEVDRTIYYCGMHSHVSAVQNGREQYLYTSTRQTCERMINAGTLYLTQSTMFTGIKPNSTTSRGVTLAGVIRNDGSCSGTTYSDPYGTWTGVVVQALTTITIQDYTAAITAKTQEIILRSGQRCALQPGSCLDTEDGHSYWDATPTDSCKFRNYDVLYEGPATTTTAKNHPTIYTVTTQDITFALAGTSQVPLCGYTLIKTEHPKLFILETHGDSPFTRNSKPATNNLDIFTYVNSKFIYVERHLRTQITQLYNTIVTQKCHAEVQIIRNALSQTEQDLVALAIMQKPGFLAVPAGEGLHIIQCIPRIVQIRRTDECYQELPIILNNRTAFIKPRTHIITEIGTRKKCNDLLPTLFRINNKWYKIMPRPIESLPPQTMEPFVKPTWEYVEPQNIATSGIYTSQEIEELKNHIMFPVEKHAALESLAQGITGNQYSPGSISITNLLTEKELKTLTKSLATKLWEKFALMGNITSGAIGAYLVFRLIKTTINIILNGISLHKVYGWSFHIISALWTTLANFLLNNKRNVGKQEEGNVSEVTPCVKPSAPKPITIELSGSE